MTGRIRQILVDGAPTTGRMDDTHIWGAGGLLTGAPGSGLDAATDGHTRYLWNELHAYAARDAAMEELAARIFSGWIAP
ncbi:MAG: hypothetical protein WCP98_18075 [Actinomycetes bacterium]